MSNKKKKNRKNASRKPAPNKVSAQKAEALGEGLAFEHREVTFTVRPVGKYPVAVLETDDEVEVLKLILGKDQWAAYLNTEPTLDDLPEFLEKFSTTAGGDAEAGN
ncbi:MULTISPECIES: hypothetical protein [unclassified Streptomyces]|uniref:hypothetical protein n=1 Tax=unclassified Streptomyces TaxID=2593676 RepID=UPI00081DEDDA|nr:MULTISPECIES: hypothetical protein [unclassified Streptomyces]MYR95462.1 hypothetical protein [Streptomyces sp. SID4937]SCD90814.1 hypothetical protein GA0115243_104747 [Streptomyces sp. ScaeMP-e83]